MAKTLVGAFDDAVAAQNAVRDLQAAGVRSNHIRMMSGAEAYAGAEQPDASRSWADKVGDWFGSLFDDADDKRFADDYAEAYRRGQILVIADVEDVLVESSIGILNRYGTVDLSSRAKKWKEGGYRGFDRTARPYSADERAQELAAYQGQVLPVVQEEMAVGKRVVQRGGVRVHSYVQERPVEEIVRLREERIDVQRRPANRIATDADRSFEDRTLEVTAMGEEPVVTKKARVVEEVVVGKQVEERAQTVKGKVRRTDVKVDSVPISSRRADPPESQRHN